MTQLIAAPLASLFLILSLCAFKINSSNSFGEEILLTRVFQNEHRFMSCLDDHRTVLRLHPNSMMAIGIYEYPRAQLPLIAHKMLQYQGDPSVWLLADPETKMQDIDFALDGIHAASPSVRTLLITAREKHELDDPEGSFKSIAPIDPDRFSDPPSICIMPPFPKFAIK